MQTKKNLDMPLCEKIRDNMWSSHVKVSRIYRA
jgi:hypothetical protein